MPQLQFSRNSLLHAYLNNYKSVQHLLDLKTRFDIIQVNSDSPTMTNTSSNPVIFLQKEESLTNFPNARQLNTMINETKSICPLKSLKIVLKRIKNLVFWITDMISAYNEKLPNKFSEHLISLSMLDISIALNAFSSTFQLDHPFS